MNGLSISSVSRSVRRSLSDWWPRLVLLGSFFFAVAAITPRMDGDARLLAATGLVALLGIGFLDRPRGVVTGSAAVLLLFVLLTVPSPPLRGTCFLLAAAAATAVVGTRRWLREGELGFSGLLGLALVLQAGFRPEWLLPGAWGPETVARLLFPPVAVAAAGYLLRFRYPPRSNLVLLLLTVVVCRGATLTAAFALVAPVAIELLRDRGPRVRGVALALALAGLAWRPWLVGVGALAAIFLRLPAVGAALGGGLLAAGSLLAPPSSGAPGLWVPLLLCPALLWPGGRHPVRLGAGALLAWGGWRLAGAGGLALGASWLVAALFEEEEVPAPALPWIVTAGLALWLVRGYPWMGESERLLRALGFPGPWWAAAILGLLFVAGSVVARRWRGAWPGVVVVLWAGLILAAGPPGRTLRSGAVPLVLTDEARVWWTEEGGPAVETVTVESVLTNAAGLRDGTEVGRVVLIREGQENVRWPVRVGETTGEWAARSRPGVPAPEPWSVWVAEDSFFGQRYRGVWEPETPVHGVDGVRLIRSKELPEDVEWIVWTVRVVPP
ncbi:MAG: hypothetical protein R3234_06855 [Thermoanaerobaculia bacterium]|nr:hypothetical protein [Thermoanaerobaculia bacterium]